MFQSKTVLRLLAVSACVLFAAGCKGKVNQVKNHVWEGDKGTTLGKALDNYNGFEEKTWSVKKTDNGKEYVEFTGKLPQNSKKLEEAKKVLQKISIVKSQIASGNIGAINFYYDQRDLMMQVYNNNIENTTDYKLVNNCDFSKYANNFVENTPDIIKSRLTEIEVNLNKYTQDTNKITSFYSNGNRMELVYQFIINQDKTIDVSYGGCQTSKEKKSSDMTSSRFNVLTQIYKNGPIDGVCTEPI